MSWEKEKSRHVDFQCVRSKSISNLLEISTDLTTAHETDADNLTTTTTGYSSSGVESTASNNADSNSFFSFNPNGLLQSAPNVIQTRFTNANASLLSPSLNNRYFNPIHLASESNSTTESNPNQNE